MSILHVAWNKVENAYRWTKNGARSTAKWLPVIWNDRSWDQVFLYEILKRKLELMEEAFRSTRAYSKKSTKEADNIKRCILVLNRLIKNQYHENVYMFHYKKWGNPEYEYKEVPYSDGEFFEVVEKQENVRTPEDKEKERREFLGRMGDVNYLINQDLEYLFKVIKKHVNNWWD